MVIRPAASAAFEVMSTSAGEEEEGWEEGNSRTRIYRRTEIRYAWDLT